MAPATSSRWCATVSSTPTCSSSPRPTTFWRTLEASDHRRLPQIFTEWNRGILESFLIEITGQIFAVRDEVGGPLIDVVLDKAGQKGTGRWTARVAIDHGVPIPSIAVAIDARVLSSRKAERVAASEVLSGPPSTAYEGDITELVALVHDALYAAKIVACAQGMDLIARLSDEHDWNINLREMARIWKGGCIIRALLSRYHHEGLRAELRTTQSAARR